MLLNYLYAGWIPHVNYKIKSWWARLPPVRCEMGGTLSRGSLPHQGKRVSDGPARTRDFNALRTMRSTPVEASHFGIEGALSAAPDRTRATPHAVCSKPTYRGCYEQKLRDRRVSCRRLPGADSGTAAAVEGGTASFVVNTTVPGISVKGKSTALEAHAVVERVPDGLHLEKVEASIAVTSILTGMAIRDEHMRRYIFTTADGKTPDLKFETDRRLAPCRPGEAMSSPARYPAHLRFAAWRGPFRCR